MKILKFYADWCMPCRSLTQLMNDNKESIQYSIEMVDIDDQTSTAQHYGVRGVPTLILVDDNNAEVRRISGMLSTKQLLEFVK